MKRDDIETGNGLDKPRHCAKRMTSLTADHTVSVCGVSRQNQVNSERKVCFRLEAEEMAIHCVGAGFLGG